MGFESNPVKDGPMEAPAWSVSTAIAEINIIEQNIRNGMGAADVEPGRLAHIRSDVINSKISPAKGVEQARALEEGRNESH